MGIDRYTPEIQTASGPNITRAELGPLSDLGRYEIEITARKSRRKGKVFLKELLGLSGMELSLTRLAAGQGVPFLHAHRQHEELYLFTSGRGQMQVDGRTFDVREGSLVRVAPAGIRSVRAAPDSDLGFVCIQAVQGSMPDAAAGSDGLKLEGEVGWPG